MCRVLKVREYSHGNGTHTRARRGEQHGGGEEKEGQ